MAKLLGSIYTPASAIIGFVLLVVGVANHNPGQVVGGCVLMGSVIIATSISASRR